MKTQSVLYSKALFAKVQNNIQNDSWSHSEAEKIIAVAQAWAKMSDENLWGLMFGANIDRSLHVWSDGFCPICKQDVKMYNWLIDPFANLWKVVCPHCFETFPKNDFEPYYKSGLDKRGVFHYKLANKALLFNVEHPDASDPLHQFCVDDGDGFIDGDKRWRFIGTYLYYGHWQKLIHSGICKLAAAYFVSGDLIYAHKAAVLLDRVADLYPEFEFQDQGWAYEEHHGNGYVTTWHDACEETREMALAYDQIFEAIEDDIELVDFLAAKATAYGLANTKRSFADIQRNIEDNILQDALNNSVQVHWAAKIHSNYPRREITVAILKTVLKWPENRDHIMELIDEIIATSTNVDGTTGEKGLAGYAAFVIQGMTKFLGQFDLIDSSFLPDLINRYASLKKTWRFFLDTWCCEEYYPTIGDVTWFAARDPQYQGVRFDVQTSNARRHPPMSLEPSSFSFLYRLYQISGDPAYIQILYLANSKKINSLPLDVFADNPHKIREEINEVIQREGSCPFLGSVDKQEWHLAILRSGNTNNSRAVWIDYDSGGTHAHLDGMNLGLFAYGLDLMPDFGYPPVQFGGWKTPQVKWYTMTAAHNTVVVDGLDQDGTQFDKLIHGKTTLFKEESDYHIIRISGTGLYPPRPELKSGGCQQYERTVILVDMPDPENFYLIDIFRVLGGHDHAKFAHSNFGDIATKGLSLKKAPDFGHNTLMRNFRQDSNPKQGWSVTWTLEDRYNYLPKDTQRHLRYTDLTTAAQACICEGWIMSGHYSSNEEAWIPRLMIRRQSENNDLQSTFVSVIEPFCKKSFTNLTRLY